MITQQRNYRQLFFREPFTDKYALTVKTDVLAGGVPIKTTTQIRWDMRVKPLTVDTFQLELITLNHDLIETNNPSFYEMARLTQAFARMYNELQVVMNYDGKLLKIENEDLIKAKWVNIKAELQGIDETSESIKGIIILNDEIFTSPAKMLEAVKQNEFFAIYFQYLYGRKLPANTGAVKRWNHFQQAELEWNYFIQPSEILPTQSKFINIEVTGTPITRMSKDWVKKAYGSFPNMDLDKLMHPRHTDIGKYTVQTDLGKITSAHILKEEVAHPQLLFSRLEYHLISDEATAKSHSSTAVQVHH